MKLHITNQRSPRNLVRLTPLARGRRRIYLCALCLFLLSLRWRGNNWRKQEQNRVAHIGTCRASGLASIEEQAAPTILQREQCVRRELPPIAREIALLLAAFANQAHVYASS
jgi:hypothetical protein